MAKALGMPFATLRDRAKKCGVNLKDYIVVYNLAKALERLPMNVRHIKRSMAKALGVSFATLRGRAEKCGATLKDYLKKPTKEDMSDATLEGRKGRCCLLTCDDQIRQEELLQSLIDADMLHKTYYIPVEKSGLITDKEAAYHRIQHLSLTIFR